MIRKTSALTPASTTQPKASPAPAKPQNAGSIKATSQTQLAPQDQAQTQALAAAKQPPEIVALADTDTENKAPSLDEVRQGAVIEPGMSGESVTAVQKLLSEKGFGVAATGTLGETTAGQISAFQKDRGLEEDGRVGRNTLGALESTGSTDNLDAEINQLKSQFVSRGRVSAARTRALGNAIDQMLSKPDVRQALIERFDLGSATNRKALVAVTAVESGSNGDMGEVMSTVMNRALVKNLVREITGIGGKTSIMDVVNDGNQFSSKAGVRRIMNGGDTSQRHYANFRQPAEAILDQVLDGKHTFKNNASKIYYFDQGGAKHQFKIGVHRFREGYNGKSTHYVQDELQSRKRLNW